MERYCEVYIDVRADALDRPLHYEIPDQLQAAVLPGVRVTVPLGRRKVTGIVTGLLVQPEVAATRPVLSVLDQEPLLSEEMLALAGFLAETYHSRHIEALRLLLPPGLEQARPAMETMVAAAAGIDCMAAAATLAARAPRQAAALTALAQAGKAVPLSWLTRQAGINRPVINSLVQKGLVRLEQQRQWREEDSPGDSDFARPLPLTPAQEAALVAILKAMDRGEEVLLYGVTGSGKTEVYLQAIAACLARGRQALVLVPEIALTPQMVRRFKGRFGSAVAVMHSGLTATQRLDAWWRVRLGDAPLVLGARSAVFAPLQHLGLVVMDEEHEGSYKQEEPSPRYHARTVARWRCRCHGAGLLLGSATPSLETYHRSRQEGSVLQLPTRIGGRPLPPVQVVDMRQELQGGNRTIFSTPLQEGLKLNAGGGSQTILLINRRGMASFLLCRRCGQVIRCPHCSVSLTLHGGRQKLLCHYCSYLAAVPETCPECGSRYLRPFGIGTQRVEEEVKKLLPGAAVFRLDADTAARRGAYHRILDQFAATKGAVLVGTQMVAKGLDIAGVALVGVVNADTALHLPDFRSAERTFQLLTQVAGRAGRGQVPGQVVIQTYNPDHFAIATAAAQDYDSFFAQEISLRQQLGYPPFKQMLRLLVTCPREEDAIFHARRLKEVLDPWQLEGIELLGPAEAPLAMIRGRYRWQLIMRGNSLPGAAELQPTWQSFRESAPKDLRLIVDPDPYSLL